MTAKTMAEDSLMLMKQGWYTSNILLIALIVEKVLLLSLMQRFLPQAIYIIYQQYPALAKSGRVVVTMRDLKWI